MRKTPTQILEKKPESRFVAPVNVSETQAKSEATEAAYFRSEHGARILERDFFGTRKGRKEAGRKIDPETAEVDYFYVPRIEYDVYDMRGFYEEVRKYFARSPGSIWVRFEDLPDETRHKLGQKIDAGVACWPKPEWEDDGCDGYRGREVRATLPSHIKTRCGDAGQLYGIKPDSAIFIGKSRNVEISNNIAAWEER
jgi:hypothetical protein